MVKTLPEEIDDQPADNSLVPGASEQETDIKAMEVYDLQRKGYARPPHAMD